jgi:hypothetical protein
LQICTHATHAVSKKLSRLTAVQAVDKDSTLGHAWKHWKGEDGNCLEKIGMQGIHQGRYCASFTASPAQEGHDLHITIIKGLVLMTIDCVYLAAVYTWWRALDEARSRLSGWKCYTKQYKR